MVTGIIPKAFPLLLYYYFRYSKISFVYSKFFKLWPAYVHWARGNFHLAANDFASILDSFEGQYIVHTHTHT